MPYTEHAARHLDPSTSRWGISQYFLCTLGHLCTYPTQHSRSSHPVLKRKRGALCLLRCRQTAAGTRPSTRTNEESPIEGVLPTLSKSPKMATIVVYAH